MFIACLNYLESVSTPKFGSLSVVTGVAAGSTPSLSFFGPFAFSINLSKVKGDTKEIISNVKKDNSNADGIWLVIK